jgi:hypothetical protein
MLVSACKLGNKLLNFLPHTVTLHPIILTLMHMTSMFRLITEVHKSQADAR